MDFDERERYRARAAILKALAHPTRLFIVDELGRGERCVCELREKIGADMSTVSKHLAPPRSSPGLLLRGARPGGTGCSSRAWSPS